MAVAAVSIVGIVSGPHPSTVKYQLGSFFAKKSPTVEAFPIGPTSLTFPFVVRKMTTLH